MLLSSTANTLWGSSGNPSQCWHGLQWGEPCLEAFDTGSQHQRVIFQSQCDWPCCPLWVNVSTHHLIGVVSLSIVDLLLQVNSLWCGVIPTQSTPSRSHECLRRKQCKQGCIRECRSTICKFGRVMSNTLNSQADYFQYPIQELGDLKRCFWHWQFEYTFDSQINYTMEVRIMCIHRWT